MKYLISLLSLTTVFSIAKAQTYIPFPSSNTIWTERHGNGETEPSYFCYGLKNSDTVIGSVTYHKLYRSDDTIFTESEYYGGLREDAMKHVYFLDASASSEKLLYDFSLMAGDTAFYYTGPAAIVDFIDSVNISGQYRKRFNFKTLSGTSWGSGSWVEGIGNSSLGGLLYSTMAQPTCDCANNTLCIRQDNTWLYHNPSYSSIDCLGPTLNVGTTNNNSSVTLFPNPVTDISHIHISGNKSFDHFSVYNINSVAVISYDISGSSDITLDKANLPAGVYCFRLSGNSRASFIEKFIVQ